MIRLFPALLALALASPAVAQDAPSPAEPVEDAATAGAPDPAVPQDSATRAAETEAALAEIQASITLSNDRAAELRRQVEAFAGDRDRQTAELIAAAQRVKLAEIEIGDVEERLAALFATEAEIRTRLDGADIEIANLLAALERISRNPPPALIVDPDDALGAARSAMLLSSILPELRAKAEAVVADLTALSAIKASALDEETILRTNHGVLQEEQLRIATLIEARRQGMDRVGAELEAEEAEALALAGRATTLQGLVDTLTTQIDAVARAAAAADAANAGATPPALDAQTVQLALANTERTEPALPFSSARGYLTLPSAGTRVIEYGADDGFGGIAAGISILTRAGAQVIAPADGWVLYKGDYLNYGQIVILDPGQDYLILLAGLEAVTVDLGQFVLMGEPLGTMGSRTIGRTVTTNAGNARPTLYIELRQNNAPLDPTGWWAQASNSTESG